MGNLRKRSLDEEHDRELEIMAFGKNAQFTGDAMRAILDHVADAARTSGIAEGKRWPADNESKRIWQKLKNEEARHRKDGRVDIADVLGELRKWINSKDD